LSALVCQRNALGAACGYLFHNSTADLLWQLVLVLRQHHQVLFSRFFAAPYMISVLLFADIVHIDDDLLDRVLCQCPYSAVPEPQGVAG
jgi:hypothetical protein